MNGNRKIVRPLALALALSMATGSVAYCNLTAGNHTLVVKAESNNSSISKTTEELKDALVKNLNDSSSNLAGKSETVYGFLDANGNTKSITVTDILHNKDGKDIITDATDLKDILNIKGDEKYKEGTNNVITWEADGNDITYQGTSTKDLPIEEKITYLLDGKEISADDLAGKSGKVTIRFNYKNNSKQVVKENGKEYTVYTPFAVVSGFALGDNFSNIEVKNGRIENVGENSVVFGITLPGFKDSLKEGNKEIADDLEIPEYFEVTADVKDFSLDMTLTVVTTSVFDGINLDNISSFSGLQDAVNKLTDATNKLVEGTTQLKDGSITLKNGVKAYTDGVSQVANGTNTLKNSLPTLSNGVSALANGSKTIAGKFTDESGILSGSAALANGVNKLDTELNKGLTDSDKEKAKSAIDTKFGSTSDSNSYYNQIKNQASSQIKSGIKNKKVYSQLSSGIGQVVDGAIDATASAAATNAADAAAKNASSNTITQIENNIYPSIAKTALQAGIENGLDSGLENGINNGFKSGVAAGFTQGAKAAIDQTESVVTSSVSTEADTVKSVIEQQKAALGLTDEQVNALYQAIDSTKTSVAQGVANQASSNLTSSLLADEAVNGATTKIVSGAKDTLNASIAQAKETAKSQISDETLTAGSTKVVEGVKASETYKAGISKIESGVNQAVSSAVSEKVTSAVTSAVKGNEKITNGKDTAAKKIADSLGDKVADSAGSAMADSVKTAALSGAESGIESTKTTLASTIENAGLVNGTTALNNGLTKLYNEGINPLNTGLNTLNSSVPTLSEGVTKLSDGAATLNSKSQELNEGVTKLSDGAAELSEGMIKFNNEGVKKITDSFDGDFNDVFDNVKAIIKAGQNYQSFTQINADTKGSVKFILKTDAIKAKNNEE
ncbi:hypothetical protein [Acetitomaculum ruminis]|uniref:hypothetical protein n=1 Tax=Acetitomaculum ruminis TaxID=2382 RepID=UPI000AE6B267|nr:hypothetical protein [Acetitomaculum ruminis]